MHKRNMEQYNKAMSLYKAGTPIVRIASICKVPETTAYGWVYGSKSGIAIDRKQNMEKKKTEIGKKYMDGCPVKTLAKEYSVSVATIYRWISLAG